MEHTTKTGVTCTFEQDGKYGVPSVTLRNVPSIPGENIYHASQFLSAAASGRGFAVTSGWLGWPDHEIDAEDVKEIARMVLDSTDPSKGRFETRWVAADPSLPF